jgi:predicted metal-binding transcription factor (methanogenesis marker protein 9)
MYSITTTAVRINCIPFKIMFVPSVSHESVLKVPHYVRLQNKLRSNFTTCTRSGTKDLVAGMVLWCCKRNWQGEKVADGNFLAWRT